MEWIWHFYSTWKANNDCKKKIIARSTKRNFLSRRRNFWARRTGLEKALLAALGVCGLAMVAGGSYYAYVNNDNATEDGPLVKGTL